MTTKMKNEKNEKNERTTDCRIGQNETKGQALYRKLNEEPYLEYPYSKSNLDEGMWILNQVINGYWKPRYLIDENNGTAVEFMDEQMTLLTVKPDDVDWASLEGMSEDVTRKARTGNAVYPTFVRAYEEGLARVDWQLNPDGYYYMDEDGYGMTDDEEITVYGYIDRQGRVLGKFRRILDFKELNGMKEEAGRRLKALEKADGSPQ